MHSFFQIQNGEEEQGQSEGRGAAGKKIAEKRKKNWHMHPKPEEFLFSQRNFQFSKELAGITLVWYIIQVLGQSMLLTTGHTFLRDTLILK